MLVVSSYLDSTQDVLRSAIAQRRLLRALARRDLSDDYVEHSLSLLWNLILPLFAVGVYLFVFTEIFPARVQAPVGYQTDGIVFLMAGIVPWMALAQTLGRATTCIVNNANIVRQMAFPLELLPLKTLASTIVFFALSLLVMVGYAGWITNGAILPVYAWGIPLLLLLSITTFAGLALLVSALQVFLRDTKEFVSMFLSIGLFLHPILYLPNSVPEAVRGFLYASPFSQLIFCWHDILFFGAVTRPSAWVAAFLFATLTFVVGARLFMGSKGQFGDFL
ncbi:MAG TPA: ABC transporter permease [Burkholderiaceae bacterium]|nr:ABC transporter permease [Burkholderiaceae bacterium]